MSGEFEIIRRFFSSGFPSDQSVIAGVGDDGALIEPGAGMHLAASCDTLVAGVHFPDGDPADIAYRSLAVNLSDMAAMGASPRWVTLAITVPEAHDDWFEAFAAGLRECAIEVGCALIGGDTTRGPLSVTIQVIGEVPPGKALLRSGAQPGDAIYVSGSLGAAAAYIAAREGRIALPDPDSRDLATAFWRPTAQIGLGIALRGIATAAIDISDGLIRDLAHILEASGIGATLDIDALPLADGLRGLRDRSVASELAATGGDDYQLCFTVPKNLSERLTNIESEQGVTLTRVGSCDRDAQLRTRFDGNIIEYDTSGYEHFSGDRHG